MFWLFAIQVFASSGGMQEINIQVVAPEGITFNKITAEITRLGDLHEITLSDEGLVSGDTPYDGIWVGIEEGEFARYLPVRLMAQVQDGGEEITLYSGLEWTPDRRRADIGYQITENDNNELEAMRVAVPSPGKRMRTTEFLRVTSGFGWAILALCLVAVARLNPKE